jgi:formate hydrogenlyase subunit 4
MLLEYSGRRLGMLLYAAQIKQALVLSLLVALVASWGMTLPLPLALIIWILKLAVLGIVLACVETGLAKLRILRLPDLLAGSFVLGGLSLVARAMWG